jgi:hypothetical protein
MIAERIADRPKRVTGGVGTLPWSSRKVDGADGEYELRLARTLEEREQAWGLVYRNYREKGYAAETEDGLWYGKHDALAGTMTVLVFRNGSPVATMSLYLDSGAGLPADTLYPDELGELRRQGKRLVEVGALASIEQGARRSRMVLENMIRFVMVGSTRVLGATDMVITVNPHHKKYYEKVLFFVQRGEECDYGKVNGAPAVLLQLDLLAAPENYCTKYGTAPNSLYRLYFGEYTDQEDMVLALKRGRQPLPEDVLVEYFARRRPLWPEASLRQSRSRSRGLFDDFSWSEAQWRDFCGTAGVVPCRGNDLESAAGPLPGRLRAAG